MGTGPRYGTTYNHHRCSVQTATCSARSAYHVRARPCPHCILSPDLSNTAGQRSRHPLATRWHTCPSLCFRYVVRSSRFDLTKASGTLRVLLAPRGWPCERSGPGEPSGSPSSSGLSCRARRSGVEATLAARQVHELAKFWRTELTMVVLPGNVEWLPPKRSRGLPRCAPAP